MPGRDPQRDDLRERDGDDDRAERRQLRERVREVGARRQGEALEDRETEACHGGSTAPDGPARMSGA